MRYELMTLSACVLLVASGGPQAAAQPSILKVALCKQLRDDTARLKCYDEAFEELGKRTNEATKEKPAAVFVWSVAEDKSPIDNSPQVTGTLRSGDGASLLVRCREKKTEVAIGVNGYLGSMRDSVPALLRVNDAPAVTESWTSSSNGQGAFSRNAVATLKALPDNATLFVRLTGHGGKEYDAKFELGAVSEIREKVREACKWADTNTVSGLPKGSRATGSARPEPKQ